MGSTSASPRTTHARTCEQNDSIRHPITIQIVEKIGIIQSIVSAVERDERKLTAEMAVRFALALATMDELLHPQSGRSKGRTKKPSRD